MRGDIFTVVEAAVNRLAETQYNFRLSGLVLEDSCYSIKRIPTTERAVLLLTVPPTQGFVLKKRQDFARNFLCEIKNFENSEKSGGGDSNPIS